MKRKASSFNVNDLSTWGWPVAAGAGLLIIAILVYALKSLLIDNITREVDRKSSEISKVEQEYLRNKKILATLPHIRKEVSELEKIRDAAKKFLPTDVSMPNLIDNVYSSARKNSIIFKSFAPQADIETPYYTIKPVSLSTSTGYLSMAAFIEDVTTLERIMNVHSVTFTSKSKEPAEDENTPLNVTAQLRTYIFKE